MLWFLSYLGYKQKEMNGNLKSETLIFFKVNIMTFNLLIPVGFRLVEALIEYFDVLLIKKSKLKKRDKERGNFISIFGTRQRWPKIDSVSFFNGI